MRLIERDHYLNKLKDVMGTPDIKVITGIRRSGKSKLMESFISVVREDDPEANIIHVNFNMNSAEGLAEYHVRCIKRHFYDLFRRVSIHFVYLLENVLT